MRHSWLLYCRPWVILNEFSLKRSENRENHVNKLQKKLIRQKICYIIFMFLICNVIRLAHNVPGFKGTQRNVKGKKIVFNTSIPSSSRTQGLPTLVLAPLSIKWFLKFLVFNNYWLWWRHIGFDSMSAACNKAWHSEALPPPPSTWKISKF